MRSHPGSPSCPFHRRGKTASLVIPMLLCLVALASRLHAEPADLPLSDADLEARLDAYLLPFVAMEDLSGVLLVARGEQVLYEDAFGIANRTFGVPMTPTTRFLVGSVSKTFTAAAILLLEERGQLGLADTVDLHLPSFPGGKRITIEQVLRHVAGLPRFFPDMASVEKRHWEAAGLLAMIEESAIEDPGDYAYSNVGYTLLARIIEAASGGTYQDFLERNVFAPLGLAVTAHGDATEVHAGLASGYLHRDLDGVDQAPLLDPSAYLGAGSLVSSARDLHRFVRALVDGRLLRPDTVGRMFADRGDGYGYGWFVGDRSGRSYVEHNGYLDGYRAYLGYYPAEDLTVVLLSNVGATAALDRARADVARILFGEDIVPPPLRTFIRLSERERAALVGRYAFAFRKGFVLTVKEVERVLMISVGGPFSALYAESATRLFHRRSYTGYAFSPDESGRMDRVVMTRNGKAFPAQRIEEPSRKAQAESAGGVR